jgi:transcriptional regulator with XRE-family HTH domain
MTITPGQVKAARKLLGWSQSELAGHAGVSASTVGYFEAGDRRSVLDLSVVRRMLEDGGVEFVKIGRAPGVKLKAPGATIPADNLSGE